MSLKIGIPFHGSFPGRNGAGSITLIGAKIGDLALLVGRQSDALDGNGYFEFTISVNDQIQQTIVADLTGANYEITLFRPVA